MGRSDIKLCGTIYDLKMHSTTIKQRLNFEINGKSKKKKEIPESISAWMSFFLGRGTKMLSKIRLMSDEFCHLVLLFASTFAFICPSTLIMKMLI